MINIVVYDESHPLSNIVVTYRIRSCVEDIERIARQIAIEETVEVPESIISDTDVVGGLIGEVLSIEQLQPDAFSVRISYRSDLASGHLPQFCNLIYGNISLRNDVRVIDLSLPHGFLQNFKGPRFGIAGIRERLGVFGRPLLATALKPRGSTSEQLAMLAEAFAKGGGDIVKDDHNLVDETFDAFVARVRCCSEAIMRANSATGRNTLYFPALSAPLDRLERFAAATATLGIPGILVAPFLTGIDTVRMLAERYDLIIMAHPTFSGTFFQDEAHGIEPGLLLGTILRLAGVDISVFPNAGGRFVFSRPQCSDIAERLRGPLGHFRPALPMPAGGIQLTGISGIASDYGEDVGLLVGGALLESGSTLREATVELLDTIQGCYSEVRKEPLRTGRPSVAAPDVLKVDEQFKWSDRPRVEYGAKSQRIPFKGITRTELFGKLQKEGNFDLRYFEIEPDGYSSREQHVHVHVVIGARGSGLISLDGVDHSIGPNDVIYVPALCIHQLRNTGADPFGFYCIVDRHRDRPLDPKG